MHLREGLAANVWHKSAPKTVQKAVATKDTTTTFLAWSSCLSQNKFHKEYIEALAGPEPPLVWGLPQEAADPATVDLLCELEHLAACSGGCSANKAQAWSKAATAWLQKIESGRFGLVEAYETLAWSHALPALAVLFAESLNKDGEYKTLWWALLESILTIANEADASITGDSPLLPMLVTAELGLTLAYLFPELEPCRDLVKPARKSLNEGITELLDGEGLLEAKHFELMRPLLACWVRCLAVGDEMCDGKLLKKDPAGQLEWAVREAMRWTRSDGSQVLCEAASGRWCKPLFEAALVFDEDDEDQDIATMTLPDWGKKAQIATLRQYALADAASHSEWSRAAVLRPDWEQAGPRFSILYPHADKNAPSGDFFIELENERQLLLSGEWQYHLRLGSKTLEPVSDWEQTCWVTDNDIDYIELQQELAGGYMLQRHIAMAREDWFLFMADMITGPGVDKPSSKLRYTASLPLVSNVVLEANEESREIRLTGVKSLKSGKPGKPATKSAATLLPIGLSEWKADGNGSLQQAADGRLELSMTGTQYGLYVPLFIDLDVKRMVKPLTWRTLTVAESLEVVAPDRAVGYRVQAGDRQWLIYRSLDLPENRTVLGENLIAETLIAQFEETGQTNPLVAVQ